MNIKIINREDFPKYEESIKKIHLENIYPDRGYLIDEDYIDTSLVIICLFDNDELIGYASIAHEEICLDEGSCFNVVLSDNNIKISQVALNPLYQNKGLGTKLFDYIKKYANDNNIDYIYLYTMSDNLKGQNFYLKNGFIYSGFWHAKEYKNIKNFKSYFYSYKAK